MLRPLLLFPFLLAVQSSHSQDSLVSKLSNAACNCFGKIKTQKGLNEESAGDCIGAVMAENSAAITAESMRVYGDTSETSIYKLGENLFNRIKLSLVDGCYDFFVLMDSIRYGLFKGLNGDSLKKELGRFNQTSRAPDSSTFYTDRGILKFQLRDFNGAYNDLDKAIYYRQDNIPAHFFRGWSLEMKKEYGKAVSDFEYVSGQTNDSSDQLLVAIVKRKKRMAEEAMK